MVFRHVYQQVDVLLLACGSKEKDGEETLKKGEKYQRNESREAAEQTRKEEIRNGQVATIEIQETKEFSSVASNGKIYV